MDDGDILDEFLGQCMDHMIPLSTIKIISDSMLGKSEAECKAIAVRAIALIQAGALTKETAKKICLEDSKQ